MGYLFLYLIYCEVGFSSAKKLEDEFVLVARTVIHLVFVVAFAEITPSGIGARLRVHWLIFITVKLGGGETAGLHRK